MSTSGDGYVYVRFAEAVIDVAGASLDAWAAGGANPYSVGIFDAHTVLLAFGVPVIKGDELDVSTPTGIVFGTAGDVAPGAYTLDQAVTVDDVAWTDLFDLELVLSVGIVSDAAADWTAFSVNGHAATGGSGDGAGNLQVSFNDPVNHGDSLVITAPTGLLFTGGGDIVPGTYPIP